ncbi:hypothetical protein [Hymenobacter sp. B1770]|uniref:hypothetical protein n=1 Tax=Hymenobacter sp. B1770 TaxID=1718788 RepID=UPI003CEB41AF
MASFFCLSRGRNHVIHLINCPHQRVIHSKVLGLSVNTTTLAGKFMLAFFAFLAKVRP